MKYFMAATLHRPNVQFFASFFFAFGVRNEERGTQ